LADHPVEAAEISSAVQPAHAGGGPAAGRVEAVLVTRALGCWTPARRSSSTGWPGWPQPCRGRRSRSLPWSL